MTAEPHQGSRFRVNQWFAIATAALGIVTVAGIVIGVFAIVNLGDKRELVVDRIDPAVTDALRLSNALINEETGVRGYVLAGDADFLEPYVRGRAEERRAARALRERLRGTGLDEVLADLGAVERSARRWRAAYAQPTIARVRRDGAGAIGNAGIDRGQRLFDSVRRALDRQQSGLAAARAEARAEFADAATFLSVAFGAIALLVAAALITTLIMLRRTVTLPIGALARRVRRVSRGNFDVPVTSHGPRDIAALAADIDSMRERILAEARELERSNAELEQFAYVASHDLQEPLRKVASFCQLLEQRYKGQLDERADQYIEFAVDGAKRMQQLINDLLAFSRVGRMSGELEEVDLGELARRALANLDTAVVEAGARVEIGDLPTVRGEPSLLTALLQNLIGNAVKFRSEAPPEVTVTAERRDGAWTIACSDNGIGIDAEYADRVFVIFQRLHPKDEYAGTGIGLAMCRKIVEYHGGTIWLDTDVATGTTFRFTLPALQESR